MEIYNRNLKNKDMNTISKKYVVDYLVSNYGEMRHDAERMVRALRVTAK